MKLAVVLCIFAAVSLSSATLSRLRRVRQSYESGLVSGIGIGIGIGGGRHGGSSGGNRNGGQSGSNSGSQGGNRNGGKFGGSDGASAGASANANANANSNAGIQGGNNGGAITGRNSREGNNIGAGPGGDAVGSRSGSEVTNAGNLNAYQNNLDRSRSSGSGFTDNTQGVRGFDNSGSTFSNSAELSQSNRQFTPQGGFSESSLNSADRSSGSNFRNTGFDANSAQRAGFNFDNEQLKASQAGLNANYFNQGRANSESFGIRN